VPDLLLKLMIGELLILFYLFNSYDFMADIGCGVSQPNSSLSSVSQLDSHELIGVAYCHSLYQVFRFSVGAISEVNYCGKQKYIHANSIFICRLIF